MIVWNFQEISYLKHMDVLWRCIYLFYLLKIRSCPNRAAILSFLTTSRRHFRILYLYMSFSLSFSLSLSLSLSTHVRRWFTAPCMLYALFLSSPNIVYVLFLRRDWFGEHYWSSIRKSVVYFPIQFAVFLGTGCPLVPHLYSRRWSVEKECRRRNLFSFFLFALFTFIVMKPF